MPRVTISFKLPEERDELSMALRARALADAIDDLRREFKSRAKHTDAPTTWSEAYELLLAELAPEE